MDRAIDARPVARSGRPGVADALVATACALVAVFYVLVALQPGGVPRVTAVAQMLLALSLSAASLFWRVRPRGAGIVIAILLGGWAITFWTALPVHTGLTPYLALAGFVVYAWTRWAGSRRWEVAAAVMGVIGALVSPGNALPTPEGFRYDVPSVVLQCIALSFAWLLARHHRGQDEAVVQAARASREKQEAEARARTQQAAHVVQAERERIASEIHDILAHSLTLIHARSTAGLIQGDADPVAACRALTDVRENASAALADVRSLVGTLNRADTPAAVAPVGDLRDILALLDRFRAAGLAINAHTPTAAGFADAQDRIPLLVRLALLRILEEGLTNALRHGDTTIPVRLSLHIDESVRVLMRSALRDDDPADGSVGTGTGLAGLAARIGALRGTVSAQPCAAWFEIDAFIPLQSSEPEAP